jgi:hypothetical protein
MVKDVGNAFVRIFDIAIAFYLLRQLRFDVHR